MRVFVILAACAAGASSVNAFQSYSTPPPTIRLQSPLNLIELDKHDYSRMTRLHAIGTPAPEESTTIGETARDYLDMIRPYTIVQAVGALVVGCLAIDSKATLPTALSVYISYGAGMAANDCTDAQVDAMHASKKKRPIPSGRISQKQAWTYVSVLSLTSLLLIANNTRFLVWTSSNLCVMLLYALGLQKVFLVKNLLVGYLGVSPLVGAILVDSSSSSKSLSRRDLTRLVSLASVGMAVGVAREILKDLEDVLVDNKKAGGKSTLPHVVGARASHRIAYAIVWTTCAIMATPQFQSMFVGPCFPLSWAIGTAMIASATFQSVKKGEKLLKKSIYVLLGGMVGGFLAT